MEAFEALVDRHEGDLIRLAASIVRDHEAAQEAVHDAFLELDRDARGLLPRSRGHASLRGWLCRVVRNGCIDRVRRDKRRWAAPLVDGDQVDCEDRPDETLGGAERNQLLWNAVGELPPLERAAVILRYRERQSYQEIAEALGKSVSHVGVLLHRAVGRLRESAALQTEVRP